MKLKGLNRAKKSILNRWVCCVEGCEKAVAKNSDGTTEGNFKCVEHTRAYYARYWYKGQNFEG